MKSGKNPTKKQMIRLKSLLPAPENWLIVKDCPSCLQVVHRVSKETRKLGFK